jgi:2-methylisoborneol synthase
VSVLSRVVAPAATHDLAGVVHTFVEEAAVLSQLGSLALRRFLADIWAWLGGNSEWHSTTERYHGSSKA